MAFTQEIVTSFEQHALAHDVALEFIPAADALHGWIDARKMEKILINLVSNAIKYNVKGGTGNLAETVSQEFGYRPVEAPPALYHPEPERRPTPSWWWTTTRARSVAGVSVSAKKSSVSMFALALTLTLFNPAPVRVNAPGEQECNLILNLTCYEALSWSGNQRSRTRGFPG